MSFFDFVNLLEADLPTVPPSPQGVIAPPPANPAMPPDPTSPTPDEPPADGLPGEEGKPPPAKPIPIHIEPDVWTILDKYVKSNKKSKI